MLSPNRRPPDGHLCSGSMLATEELRGPGPSPLDRVLVLDAWERMALAVCRALGHAGHRVGVAGTGPRGDIAARSRYVRRYHQLPDPWAPAAPYEAALGELVEREGYTAVVSVHDATLARLASIDVPVPGLAVQDEGWHLVQDKVGLAEVCAGIDVPYPRARSVPDRPALAPVLDDVGLPAFVKSGRSAVASAERVAFGRGAFFVQTLAEAEAAFDRLTADGLPVIAQTRVEQTEKLNAVVLRRDGRSEVRYAHRVLREHPRSGGTGISLQSIDPSGGAGAEAVGILERVCEAVEYQGIVQCEVYRSSADGRLHLIDVNPRLWGSTWFAEKQELRIVERSLRAALDLPALPPPVPRPGARFHVPSSVVRWFLREPDKVAGIRDLATTTRPGDVFEWIDGRDPRPTLRYLADGVLAFPGSATERRGR